MDGKAPRQLSGNGSDCLPYHRMILLRPHLQLEQPRIHPEQNFWGFPYLHRMEPARRERG